MILFSPLVLEVRGNGGSLAQWCVLLTGGQSEAIWGSGLLVAVPSFDPTLPLRSQHEFLSALCCIWVR